MKKRIGFICFVLSIFMLFSGGTRFALADESYVYLGGMPAGFSLSTRGVCVVGLCDVITEKGLSSPARESGIEVGDVILKINDNEINSALDIERCIKKCDSAEIEIIHKAEKVVKTLNPAKDINGMYKIGVFVKDSVSGIGTITFINGNRFASLGHPVLDGEGELLNIRGGELFSCNITGVIKGEKGKAGELRGVFLRKNPIASIDKNLTCGVFGTLSENEFCEKLTKIMIGEAKMGDAVIYTTINGGEPNKYDISIVKVDNLGDSKNFVIKVTDDKLIEETGGIVQGMSGSPIVQDGKLVGAVTHVFINDSTRGFGISINNMINK